VTISAGAPTRDEVEAFAAAGVDRLVVAPWRRSHEFGEALCDLAARCL